MSTMSRVAGALLGGAVAAGAGAAEPVTVSLQGTLVDVHCFAQRRAAEMASSPVPACAPGLASHPLGVVVGKDGASTLYVLATPPSMLAGHVGRRVRVRVDGQRSPLGDVVKPERVQVLGPAGWERVELLPEM